MSAAEFPSWVLLEPFVFRRDDDDDDSFPDETKAPIRATGTTTWGATFRIAFSVADPPRISRLYAQLPAPGFLGCEANPLAIVGTHRHLALFRVGTQAAEEAIVQNFFVFNAKHHHPSSELKLLPPCTEPSFDYSRRSLRLPRRRRLHRLPDEDATPRLLNFFSLGFWCRGEEDEFVVAELTLFKPIDRSRVFADICLLHSTSDAAADQQLTWKSMRVELFLSTNNNRSAGDAYLCQIRWWYTDAVIPFDKWLCWVDYQRGILLCDMSKLPNHPTVSFIWFPLDKLPISGNRNGTSTCCYRAVSVVDRGRKLKFVNITRQDGVPFAALKPGTGFTVTCHTLVLGGDGSMAWKEDYTVTSGELWEANTPDRLPRHILMFPRVDMDRPHVAHFLSVEFGFVNKKMWLVSIDMSTRTVESSSLYINGNEGLQTDDADLIRYRSMSALPFMPCEFPEFLNSSRERKDIE